MAGLRKDQQEISLDTIYRLTNFSDTFKYGTPSIFIKGDSSAAIDIYTDEETPSELADMQLEHEDIQNHKSFLTIPNYLYVSQSAGTVSKVILTGIKATEI